MADVSWRVWNAWNMEPTVPSISDKTNFLEDKVKVGLVDVSYTIDIYNTPIGKRWLIALEDNLKSKKILEKNFCFLGFADSKRNLNYLVEELNKSIQQINSFHFTPAYEHIHPFRPE